MIGKASVQNSAARSRVKLRMLAMVRASSASHRSSPAAPGR